MRKLSVLVLLVVLVNLSWADVTTTDSSFPDSTFATTESDIGNETESDIGNETESDISNETESDISNETETDISNESGSGEDEIEAGIGAEIEDAFTCSTAGVFAHATDCHSYYECTTAESEDGSLSLLTKSCPEKEAFSIKAKRCGRDISSCQLDVQCASKGVIADPNDVTSYFICQPSFSDSDFYIFHVNCGPNKVYNPSFGAFLVNSNGEFTLDVNMNEAEDIIIIKKEIKQLKKDYKAELKKEKEQKKAEEKLKKKAEKLQKQAHKQEAANFNCETEGNFPSQLADNLYIACVNSKNKLIAVPLKCSLNATFNPQTGACVSDE